MKFETFVLVNNNLCGKLFSSLESPTTFAESFENTSVQFFIPDFNLLSCEIDNFTLKYYIESFCTDIILKQNKFKMLSPFLVRNVKRFLLLLQ